MLVRRRSAHRGLLLVMAFAVAACGSGESPTDAEGSVTSEPPASEPAESTTTVTDPPSTQPVVSDVVSTEPPVTEAEPEFAAFTIDDLAAAAPTPDDIGEPWTGIDGDTVVTDLQAREGFGVGTCGGPNAMGRAEQNGVTAAVQSLLAVQSNGSDASTSLYSFGDADAASRFVALTAELADCPDAVTWERVQRTEPTGPDEFNGFGPGFEEFVDGEIWTFFEFAVSEYLPSPDLGADEVLYIEVAQDRELTAVGITFLETVGTVARYARYDNVVIVTQVRGKGNFAGWLNIDELVDSLPGFEALDAYASVAEPIASSRLGLS